MDQDIPKEQLLSELGLSKNDSKIYLTLLKHGPSTVTIIPKQSGIHRANVYSALERLRNKGLASDVIQKDKKLFGPADPSLLINLLQEKEMKLRAMLPQFSLDYSISQKENTVEVYNGAAAFRNLFLHYLEVGKNIYAFGIPEGSVSVVGEYFQNTIHKRRAKNKQWMYHIYNSAATDRMKFLNTLPYTNARHLPKEYDIPVITLVCGDEVAIVSVKEHKPTIVIIHNKDMAEAYQKYFMILWEKAIKPKKKD